MLSLINAGVAFNFVKSHATSLSLLMVIDIYAN